MVFVFTTVGVGALGATTESVPVIPLWNLQWYAYVLAALKIAPKLCPGCIVPLSKLPLPAVAVCATLPLFTHVTVSPALIVTF